MVFARWGASATPDQKGCNAYGSDAPPPTTSTTAAFSPDTPQSARGAATHPRNAHPGPEREPLHRLGSITPTPSWCNTPLSRVTPLSNKYRCGDMPRLLGETRGNAGQRRLKRRLTTEKQAPATRPLTAALIQLLGRSTLEPEALASVSAACAGIAPPSAAS